MERYVFDTTKLRNLHEQLYPIDSYSIRTSIDFDCLNEQNLQTLINEINNTVNNPQKVEDNNEYFQYETINVFSEKTNKVLNDLFHDKDLMFYGHGGAAKEIIETEFRCHYANLSSHFCPLSCTNESLSKLKKWPHFECKQIAIMALNKHEYNPIYKERKKENTYDTDIYSIPNEYFVGYYDALNDEFTFNPNFKKRHEYNPECKIDQTEMTQDVSIGSLEAPDEVKNFLKTTSEVSRILGFASMKSSLDDLGLIGIKKRIQYLIQQMIKQQKQFTPEFIEKCKQEYNNNPVMEQHDLETIGDDWDADWVDDTDWEEEEEVSPKM